VGGMLMFHVEMIVICYLAVFVDCDVVFAFYLCIISGTLSGTTSGTGRFSLDVGDPDGHGCHQPRRLSLP